MSAKPTFARLLDRGQVEGPRSQSPLRCRDVHDCPTWLFAPAGTSSAPSCWRCCDL